MESLVDFLGRIGHWGYGLLFLAAALESAALLGLLVPGETLVLAGGFFASQGALDLDVLVVVVALGATLGDSLGYEMGRRWGRNFLLRRGSRFGATLSQVERVDAFIARYGGWSVFLGRFVGFARALVPLLAGSLAMPYRQFLAFNAAGAALWSLAIVLLGYYVGESWRAAEAWSGYIATGLLASVGLALLLRLRKVLHSAVPLDAAVLFVALGLLATIAVDVATRDSLVRIDESVANWLLDRRIETLTTLLAAILKLHGPAPTTALVVSIGLLLFARKHYRWLAIFVAATAGGAVLDLVLDLILHRARSLPDTGSRALPGFSFPSGHVAAATLLYGYAAAFAVTHLQSVYWRVGAVAIAAAMILIVAFSGLYLDAHYLSDVLAAIAEAMAWLTLCVVASRGRLNRRTG